MNGVCTRRELGPRPWYRFGYETDGLMSERISLIGHVPSVETAHRATFAMKVMGDRACVALGSMGSGIAESVDQQDDRHQIEGRQD